MNDQQLQRMNTQEQRIAIAEWMGWKFVKMPHSEHGYYYFKPNAERIEMAKRGNCLGATPLYDIPEFCEDLNAMHEAEKGLNKTQQREYVRRLYILTNGDFEFHCASSQQRSEAICRTLWPERF